MLPICRTRYHLGNLEKEMGPELRYLYFDSGRYAMDVRKKKPSLPFARHPFEEN